MTLYHSQRFRGTLAAYYSKAEKLSFLQLQCNTISLSIDDLIVYRDYFDSPLIFLHFLKQRTLATQEKNIALNDELDHLGMYIGHNCYALFASKIFDNAEINWMGYREALDEYFNKLNHPRLHPTKPELHIQPLLVEIIRWFEINTIPERVDFSSYLLDLSSQSREEFCKKVKHALARQLKIRGPVAFRTEGIQGFLHCSCFVNQPQVQNETNERKRLYALRSLVRNNESDRMLIDLYFNQHGNFESADFTLYTPDDVKPEERDFLLTEETSNQYKTTNVKMNPGKIGRNDPCPCGSKKKFKKCCGAVANT